MNHQAELARCQELVERRLASFFQGDGLEQAMRYSLLAGGKRIRPVLTLKFCQAAGGQPEQALDFGCGVEILHTYSLIHDDLPCMDNDDLRRGKPTCHKVYGECVATLAGDALQAAAFETVLGAEMAGGPGVCARAAGVLAKAAGVNGMCGGQYWDTVGNGMTHTVDELAMIHDKKTGALLRAACLMGVLAASSGNGEEARLTAAEGYASHLGLAFQIRDDLLDATATTEMLGKPVGSDASNDKTTYVTLLGEEVCEALVMEHTALALEALKGADWPGGTEFLVWLTGVLAHRSK